jgi:hypothetical protein
MNRVNCLSQRVARKTREFKRCPGGTGQGAYQLQLLDEVVQRIARRADQAVLTANEAKQDGQLEVAEVVDLFDEALIRH